MLARRAWVLIGLAIIAVAEARADNDPATAEARRRFQQGTQLYQGKQWAEALAQFQAAYEAKPFPEFLYNIAQCHERLERREEALKAYRAYLDAGPLPEDKPNVERRIRELDELVRGDELLQRHLRAATEHFQAGRYSDALGEYEAASLLRPRPDALLGIARCHDRLDRPGLALKGYQTYLESGPAPEERPTVTRRIEELRALISGQSAPPPQAPLPPPRPRRPVLTFALLAGAVGLAIGGAVAEGVAYSRYQSALSSCAPGCRAQDLLDITTPAYVGYGLFAGAGVAAVLTVVSYLVERRGREGTARVAAAPGGLLLRF